MNWQQEMIQVQVDRLFKLAQRSKELGLPQQVQVYREFAEAICEKHGIRSPFTADVSYTTIPIEGINNVEKINNIMQEVEKKTHQVVDAQHEDAYQDW